MAPAVSVVILLLGIAGCGRSTIDPTANGCGVDVDCGRDQICDPDGFCVPPRGASASCRTCADLEIGAPGELDPEDYCGFEAGCSPGSSCALVRTLARCVCGDETTGQRGACVEQCPASCGSADIEPRCASCVLGACVTESLACMADE